MKISLQETGDILPWKKFETRARISKCRCASRYERSKLSRGWLSLNAKDMTASAGKPIFFVGRLGETAV